MTSARAPGPHALAPERRDGLVVLVLSALAAVHVFIFSAAMPFFNNVDEASHFDLVVRYSLADVPRAIGPFSEEAIPYLAVYGTSEYVWPLSAFPDGQVRPPPWTRPVDEVMTNLVAAKMHWSQQKNHEATQPPLYYTLSGLWWRLARTLGFEEGPLLYTVRFLNVFFVAALVWVGFLAARLVFPGQQFPQLAVPALLAFLPQSAFYSIQNDVLSPLGFGLLFICLTKFWRADVPSLRLGVATGLAFAATFLTKASNLPLLAVAAAAVLFKIARLRQAAALASARPALGWMILCAGLPICGWMAWMKCHFGDLTGSGVKIQFLGWTVKSFGEWWHHPIFTPHGLWTFLSGLLGSFWQGELRWHGEPLARPIVNAVYTILSLGFVGLALLHLRSRPGGPDAPERQALWTGFWSCAAALLFLAFLSVLYDFHDCFYPSREHPYFTSGRLMSGALIPFMLLFVSGMDRALSRVPGRWARPLALGILLAFMLVAETVTNRPLLSNAYNWFHM